MVWFRWFGSDGSLAVHGMFTHPNNHQSSLLRLRNLWHGPLDCAQWEKMQAPTALLLALDTLLYQYELAALHALLPVSDRGPC